MISADIPTQTARLTIDKLPLASHHDRIGEVEPVVIGT